jgi:hypothetical protein
MDASGDVGDVSSLFFGFGLEVKVKLLHLFDGEPPESDSSLICHDKYRYASATEAAKSSRSSANPCKVLSPIHVFMINDKCVVPIAKYSSATHCRRFRFRGT